MTNLLVVGFDDSPSSRRAVDFASALAKSSGASLVLAHVLDWSPYSFLTQDELAERHKRRKEELSRAESALIQPMLEDLNQQGIQAESEIRYGNIADTLIAIAKERSADQLIVGRIGSDGVVARLFGSVAGALAQSSPVPCTIIP